VDLHHALGHDLRPQPGPDPRQAAAPLPANEAQRLARLQAASVLDTAPEPAFDALTRVAARALGTPIALVTLVDGERQWFKSKIGLPDLDETPRLSSFCAHALLQPGLMVVPDAQQDPRFQHNPLVTDEPRIRFYAAAPIVLADGTVPGTVCVIDHQPREIDPDTLAVLTDLAAAASHAIELRAAALNADEKQVDLGDERNRLTNILLGTSAGTWEWHVQTGQTRFNAQYAEMLGYRLEDLQPSSVDTWIRLTHPDDSARAQQRLAEHFTDAAPPYDVEFRMRHRDGHWLWINARGRVSSWTPDGKPEWMFGIHLDITARKTAELALQRASDALELANRVARIGSWELDPVSTRIHLSDLVREMLEVGPDFEFDLASCIGFFHEGPHRERLVQAVEQALQHGQPYDLETQIVTARGHVRWVRAVGVPEMQDGHAVRMYGTFHDIDERVRAAEQRMARMQAEQANTAKSAFIARMSHELRTPLNAILGFNELLLVQGERIGSTERQGHLQHALDAGRHLLALVDDVLDLSRVESGEMTVDIRPLDMAALARLTAAELAPQAAGRGVRLALQLPKAAAVHADATRLRQVLHNLLSNAIKYNRPGGSVTLHLQPQHDSMRVQVQDDGLGLSALQQARLFEPFNRLGREASGVSGTGIGLVITRHLLRLMGSDIHVDSRPGLGSAFSFELPLAPTPDWAEEERSPGPSLPANVPSQRDDVRGTVLYVDDDPINRLLMEAMLDLRPQVRLVCADSGQGALQAARAQRFDLALVDMMLPDMSGDDVLAALRQFVPREAMPCVVVSANALQAQIDASLAVGFDDYITKPVSAQRLLAVVDQMLAGHGAG
jgi:PAS domain S-box-containing protein